MAKRFTDTEKWDRPWFRNLPNNYKLLWCYVLDKCDIAGVWYVDLEHASFHMGYKYDKSKAENMFEKQIESKGDRWLIKDFIGFQYGSLESSNKIYKSVSMKLEGFKEGAYMPHTSPINGVMVKDKEKDIFILKPLATIIPDDLKDDEAIILDWLEYKKQKNQSYKPKGLEALWRAIRAIPKEKRRESVDYCMSNNWSGLFEKKGLGPNKNTYEQELKKQKEVREHGDRIVSEFLNKPKLNS